jgi:putative ABC transport system permease protein
MKGRVAMSLARRNLLQDKTRMALSFAGVALAVMLMLLLSGLLGGMYTQIGAYLDHSPGSLVVAQKGVRNLLGATSLLPPSTEARVKDESGVARAIPIVSQFIILDLHGRKQPTYLIGYDSAQGGGPWSLASGRAPRTDDEMVFDRVLAERQNITLGAFVPVMGREFQVVGLSDGTASWMTSFIFVRKTAADALLRAPEAISFLLVTPARTTAIEALRTKLNALPGVEATRKTDMMTNDVTLIARFFSIPLQLMVAIAFLVGTLVVGLVTYTATTERRKEYGMLKAIGARNALLYRVVTMQALLAAFVGAVCGVGLALAVAQIIMALRPQFLVTIAPVAVLQSLGATLLMAGLAAFFPVRLLARLAPAEAFRQ